MKTAVKILIEYLPSSLWSSKSPWYAIIEFPKNASKRNRFSSLPEALEWACNIVRQE